MDITSKRGYCDNENEILIGVLTVLMMNFCLKCESSWPVLNCFIKLEGDLSAMIYSSSIITNFLSKKIYVYNAVDWVFVIKGWTTVSILTTSMEEMKTLANVYGI